MTEVFYIVTRKVGEALYWGAPYMEVDFYPNMAALEQAMFEIIEQTEYAVDRSASVFDQWDEAEEFFPREYHWGCQNIETEAA